MNQESCLWLVEKYVCVTYFNFDKKNDVSKFRKFLKSAWKIVSVTFFNLSWIMTCGRCKQVFKNRMFRWFIQKWLFDGQKFWSIRKVKITDEKCAYALKWKGVCFDGKRNIRCLQYFSCTEDLTVYFELFNRNIDISLVQFFFLKIVFCHSSIIFYKLNKI